MAISSVDLATALSPAFTCITSLTKTKTKTKAPTTFLFHRKHWASVPGRISCRKRPEYIPNKIPNDAYVRILDTTLRDGEQAPGAAMTNSQKLALAHQLVKLGVDVLEVGYPASSRSEAETVKRIAMEVGNIVNEETGYVPVIGAVARCMKADIDTAWEAVRPALLPRMLLFISTSEIHMKYKLNKTPEEVLNLAKDSVRYASSLGIRDIGFICEDAGRSDKEFLYEVYGEAIKAGATTLTFTDTVGYNFPSEVAQIIADLKAYIPGAQNAIMSAHCHNDLGLANSNTLAAVQAGARQVDVTINGVGERAGNCSLEEFVMAIKFRGNDLLGGLCTGVNTEQLSTTSKMVEDFTGFSLQKHKPIVGSNIFSHASGIHQHGILKNKSTYQIISPEDIGLIQSHDSNIVLGKHSGRHALKSRLLEIGYEVQEDILDKVFWSFKEVASGKKYVSDEDIQSLVREHLTSNGKKVDN